MEPRAIRRVCMISTHGYVAARPELGKPDTGGQVVYVLEVSKALARLGYQVDVFTRRFEGQPEIDVVENRCRVIRISCGGDEFRGKEFLCDHIPEWTENVERYISSHGLTYSLVNSHYWDAGLAGEGLAARLGCRHLHTPHSIGAWKRDNMSGDPAENERRYNFERRIREERAIYHGCTSVIATTPQQVGFLCTPAYDTPPEKIAVVPPGYDESRFRPVSSALRARLKKRLGLNGQIVLALGRLARNKGYDLLLQSMVPVFSRLGDARLLLAAGGSELSTDEQHQLSMLKSLAARLKIEDRVLFRDYIPDDQLPAYYQAADVFALSSRYEPFGMTAVEAMASGTPTVLTTGGGLFEQVRFGIDALYADPYDTEAYGHCIYSALQHPRLWRQLSQHGARKARSQFTWTAVTQKLLQTFDSALPTRGGATLREVPLRKRGTASKVLPDAAREGVSADAAEVG